MPVNRNALVRYRTIDRCLQNRYRKWTLDDLIEVCSEILYDYEGIEKGVSKRTIQLDLQMMRSDKLGYNAPIIVVDRKYYTYEDQGYSITNIPLTNNDLNKLSETVDLLKQFKGFSHFQDLEGMIQKLEDHVYSKKNKQRSVVDFEKNEFLKGLEYLDVLYSGITQKRILSITYQSFKAKESNSFNFLPFLLKEFKNRWFVIGRKSKNSPLLNLALDRILNIDTTTEFFLDDESFDSGSYFNDVIGVSVSPNLDPEMVVLYVSKTHAPYVLTKPLHPSQTLLKRENHGITITINVQHNFELEKEILGFGEGIKVISPSRLRRAVKGRLINAAESYNSNLNTAKINESKRKLFVNGSIVLNNIYSYKEILHIKKMIHLYFTERSIKPDVISVRKLFKMVPELKNLLLNSKLKKIIQSVDGDMFLTKAIYFNKTINNNWSVPWHQDIPINVDNQIELEGFDRWITREGVTSVCPTKEINSNRISVRVHLDDTSVNNGALKVIHGSHKNELSDSEIITVVENTVPEVCEIFRGDVHILKPMILHSSGKVITSKERQVIHLEFSSVDLPDGLEWSEKEVI